LKPYYSHSHERSITPIKYNREGDLFSVAKDPVRDTKYVLTGSADNNCQLWDCETGGFDFSGNIMFSPDEQLGCQCFMNSVDLRDPQIDSTWLPDYFCDNEKHFLLFICQRSREVLKKAKEHSRHINTIQTSVDLTMFISASMDNTTKAVKGSTSVRHAAYEEEFGRVKSHFGPINCVAFHPYEDGHVRWSFFFWPLYFHCDLYLIVVNLPE
uniref:Serine-threonine kinase receptor-associated protein n=1 Tax=Cynoglossus semilaevis TaxID=244447 RepID=A0A3P8VZF3_CYNSE